VPGHELEYPPDLLPEGGVIVAWAPGSAAWWRVLHQSYQDPDPLLPRTYGPISRFDPHQVFDDGPCQDPDERGTIYLAEERVTACREVFYDSSEEDEDAADGSLVARVCWRHRAAHVAPCSTFRLLSILGNHADAIGALPELATGPTREHAKSQAWARKIYEQYGCARREQPKEGLEDVHGMMYSGAHDEGKCIVLWSDKETGRPDLELVEIDGEKQNPRMHDEGIWERVEGEYATLRRSMVRIFPDACPRCRELGLR
jgi:hypothetical protein